ncbi:hypothetical protein [Mucilaginibacter mallensis]|nr:hypothetical protein [Mucilaginibacter mallensis]
MERIQLVNEVLMEIQGKYDTFFRNVNKSIYDYIDLIEKDSWIKVTLKEECQLPTYIAEEIKDRFLINK